MSTRTYGGNTADQLMALRDGSRPYAPGDTPDPDRTIDNLSFIHAARAALPDLLAHIAQLTIALTGLIGASDPDELRAMELAMRMLPAPEADKAVMINAIHALLGE